eukprot:2146560-Alexandrium_andersonii.AAC.1
MFKYIQDGLRPQGQCAACIMCAAASAHTKTCSAHDPHRTACMQQQINCSVQHDIASADAGG